MMGAEPLIESLSSSSSADHRLLTYGDEVQNNMVCLWIDTKRRFGRYLISVLSNIPPAAHCSNASTTGLL